MSRYRLQLTPEQERVLLRYCADARFVWNLCVEQHPPRAIFRLDKSDMSGGE